MNSEIRFHNITRRFPGIVALDGVSFDVSAGSCHAICGENGAGKSTLGKILAGIEHPDEGEIFLGGERVTFASPRDALAAGVAIVHQELAFCEQLSIAENLCLGKLSTRNGLIDRTALASQAHALLAAVGITMDVSRPLGTLGIAEQQLVQIAAAVGSGARAVVFDEPTSSLSEAEATRLFDLVRQLTARGVTVIYVSHRMPEIFLLSDTVTVLRDGKHVSTTPTHQLDETTLVEQMIGRRLESYFPAHAGADSGPELLRVEGLTSPGKFREISFTLRAGEVLGLAGLTGAGRSEIAQAIFGLDDQVSGKIYVRGEQVRIGSPKAAMAHGIGLVPEDRKRQGLILSMLARENTTLTVLESLCRFRLIRRSAERRLALEHFERLKVRPGLLESPTTALSGGNQQKLVLAKWLAAKSSILILDEPTRGVDVGAKAELHAWIDKLASEGAAILLISSELPELLSLSSRIQVLREGRTAGELSRQQADQSTVLILMAGVA